MNPTHSPFPNAQPALKLARRTPASSGLTTTPFSTGAQREIAADLAALEEREANLREYEARLRAWQEQLDAASGQSGASATNAPFLRPSSQTPFQSDAALTAAWEKFHRARALFESEQNQVRDDRMALREAEANLHRRAEELEAREARLKERELLLTIAVGPETKSGADPEAEKPKSAMERLTQAPWAVFKSGK